MSDRRQLVAVITADAKGLEAALASAGRKSKGQAKKMGKDLGKELRVSFRQGFGTAQDLIGLGGVAGLMAAGKQVHEFQTRLVRLRQSSRASAATIKGLEQSIFSVAKARGGDPNELLGGAEKYTELTGNLQGYIAALDALGTVSAASGSGLTELSEIAAAASGSMGVAANDTMRLFDVLVSQGQRGSVELRELGRELPSLIALHSTFAKQGVEGMAELGALMQAGKGGFGSAAETATGYKALVGSLLRSSGKLRGFGVKVFDKSGQKRAVGDILEDIANSKLGRGGKMDVKLQEILGSKEALLFFEAYRQKGVAFVRDLADEAKAAGTVMEGYKIWDESPAKKMAAAQAKLAEVFNESLAGHIETIAGALDHMADALSWATKHWKLLAAAWVAAKLSGGGLSGMMSAITSAAGGTAAATGKAAAAFGLLQKASLVAGAAIAGWEIGTYLNEGPLANKLNNGLNKIWDRGDGPGDIGGIAQRMYYEGIGAQVGRGGGGNAAVSARLAEIRSGQGNVPSRARAAAEASDDLVRRLLRQQGLSEETIGGDAFTALTNVSDKQILGKAARFEDVAGAKDAVAAELSREIRLLREAIKKDGIAQLSVSQNADASGLQIRRRGTP